MIGISMQPGEALPLATAGQPARRAGCLLQILYKHETRCVKTEFHSTGPNTHGLAVQSSNPFHDRSFEC